jgi:hypothetical protein
MPGDVSIAARADGDLGRQPLALGAEVDELQASSLGCERGERLR